MGYFTKYIDFYYHSYYDIFNRTSFFRPKLRIEFDDRKEQSAFAPSGISHNDTQRYLRVYVRNKGYRSVHNCQAEMTVTIPEHANHMLYPSDERKLLAWSRFPQSDDIAMQRTIRGHGKELLHIIFSDSFLNGVGADAEEKRYAGISTVENLMSITSALVPDGQTYLKPQDGFTKGEFEVEISITSDEGAFTQTKFMVSVEPNFQNLTMRRISFLDRFAE